VYCLHVSNSQALHRESENMLKQRLDSRSVYQIMYVPQVWQWLYTSLNKYCHLDAYLKSFVFRGNVNKLIFYKFQNHQFFINNQKVLLYLCYMRTVSTNLGVKLLNIVVLFSLPDMEDIWVHNAHRMEVVCVEEKKYWECQQQPPRRKRELSLFWHESRLFWWLEGVGEGGLW